MADCLIILIAAMTHKRVIANEKGLPWHIKDEIRHYRDIIKGKTIISGRKTFDEMGKPIGSHTIVVSHSDISVKGVIAVKTLDEALKIAKEYGRDVYVIGGASIFSQTINIADKLYVSLIKGDYKGDKYFPRIDASKWSVERKEIFPEFEYRVYKRKRNN